ncbi:MAG: septum formation protein Maf [Halobacteriovoraceae bacterium]|nr:septum formation protein Maf [Halobacteriovoraceae bacterium]
MTKIILATESKYKKALFNRLGYDFICEDSKLDESIIKKEDISPREMSRKLAMLKAKALRTKYLNDIIVASDQICLLDDQILNKPGNISNAKNQLSKMQGKFHSLLTSVCVIYKDQEFIETVPTKLEMHALNDEQIEHYLKKDEPFDCAGSYKIESHGISLFKSIKTDDFTSIEGLPLLKLNQILYQIFSA